MNTLRRLNRTATTRSVPFGIAVRRLVLLALCVALGGVFAPPPARAAVPVVVVDGRGWGHGVGMAQDGAYWMGVDGRTMDEILDHFYPGTGRGSNTGAVRVVVFVSPDGSAVLDFPDGGEVRSPRSGAQRAGFPVRVGPGGSVTITAGAEGYRVQPGGGMQAAAVGHAQPVQLPGQSTTTTSSTSSTSTTTTTLLPGFGSTTTTAPSSTTTTAPGSGGGGGGGGGGGAAAVTSPEPVWAGPVSAGGTIGVPARGLRYRGEVEVSAAGGPLRLVNELDVEQYLWGLGEVGASFPLPAIQAQVVAARTYALRAMAANGEICDTQRCQVYKGVNGEFRAQIDAVNSTLGTTLTYGGRFASAVYSANAAGVSATPMEGFGNPDATHPYLVAREYETRSPDPWQVRIGLADLARRLGYPGTATTARIASTGPSGRPLEVEIDGDRGAMRYRALVADNAMGLRSTMWTMRIEQADVAPDAPEAVSVIQAPPEAVGAVIEEQTQAVIRMSPSADRRMTTTTLVAAGQRSSSDDGDDGGDGRGLGWLLVVPVVLAGVYGLAELRRQGRSGTHT